MIFGLLLSWAMAANLESRALREVLRSRSARDVAELRAKIDHQRVARLACAIARREDLLPLACYELADQDRAELDHRCHRLASRLNLAERLVLPAAISKSCRADVEDALRIQSYRREAATGPNFD